MKGRTLRRTGPLGVDGPRDEGGQMDASGAVLTFTYSIVSLVEILRAKRAMVKRSAKAHFFFLNMGCPSIEIERNHLAIQSMKKFERIAAGRPQT